MRNKRGKDKHIVVMEYDTVTKMNTLLLNEIP